jgi:hypothetical protein
MHLLYVLYTDARFAHRLLRRTPGVFATLLGVLIGGIGATTAMFSLVMSLLVRPLPYPHAEVLLGLALGLAGAVLVGRVMAARVPGAAAFDPLLLSIISLVLAIAGSLASLFPALRAVRIPPAVALRYE